jgi:hypothetical protein
MRPVHSKLTIILIFLAVLTGCADPGYRPSGQANRAVDALRDVEYAGQYMINDFNPCRKPQSSKSSNYSAQVELDRYGNIVPRARVRTSGAC